MENTNKLESGFRIKDLILVDSLFTRINNVSFGDGVNSCFDVNIGVEVKDKFITVAEEVTISQKVQDIEQFKFQVRMIGVFECIGDTQITDFDEFGRVNGAAIIFPYIREHVANISLKAGMGAIILPPINFTNNKKNEK